MIDISSISAGLQSLATAIDIGKFLMSSKDLVRDAETRVKLAQMMEAVADAKDRLLQAREENRQLTARIESLTIERNQNDEVECRADGFWYRKAAKHGESPGPFCPSCWEDKHKLISVQPFVSFRSEAEKFRCPVCQTRYRG